MNKAALSNVYTFEERQFARRAAEMWREKGRTDLDPEGSFEETYGRQPDFALLERAFVEEGAPYRDYGMYGPEWQRKTEGRTR